MKRCVCVCVSPRGVMCDMCPTLLAPLWAGGELVQLYGCHHIMAQCRDASVEGLSERPQHWGGEGRARCAVCASLAAT